MPRTLIASLALLVAGLIGLALPARAASPELSVRFEIPDMSRSILIELSPTPDNSSVEVSILVRLNQEVKRLKKKFGGKILTELRGAWGAPTFDLTDWPKSDSTAAPICQHRERWQISTRKDKRFFCQNQSAMTRLKNFQQTVQAVLRD